MANPEIVFAQTTTSVLTDDGRTAYVRYGQHWTKNDPVVKRYPDLFVDDPRIGLSYSDEVAVVEEFAQADEDSGEETSTTKDGETSSSEGEPPVETATANPGQRRATRRG